MLLLDEGVCCDEMIEFCGHFLIVGHVTDKMSFHVVQEGTNVRALEALVHVSPIHGDGQNVFVHEHSHLLTEQPKPIDAVAVVKITWKDDGLDTI